MPLAFYLPTCSQQFHNINVKNAGNEQQRGGEGGEGGEGRAHPRAVHRYCPRPGENKINKHLINQSKTERIQGEGAKKGEKYGFLPYPTWICLYFPGANRQKNTLSVHHGEVPCGVHCGVSGVKGCLFLCSCIFWFVQISEPQMKVCKTLQTF